MQQSIGIDDADQCDIGKIEPLGDHLRPQENLNVAMSEFFECHIVGSSFLHRVTIHAQALEVLKSGPDFAFQPLRPQSKVGQARAMANGTDRGWLRREIAAMAQRDRTLFMPGEGDVTVGTFHSFTTSATPDDRRVSTDIQKQDDLSAVIQSLVHRLKQRTSDGGSFANCRIVSGIDDDHRRKRQVFDTFGHRNQRVVTIDHPLP